MKISFTYDLTDADKLLVYAEKNGEIIFESHGMSEEEVYAFALDLVEEYEAKMGDVH